MRKALAYVPICLLAVGCALLWNAHAQKAVPIAGSLSSILSDTPGLVFVDQRISENERRIAGMTDYVARAYRRDSAVAFTTFVSYYDRQTKGKTIHSPRNCLPGAGWEVVSGGALEVFANGTVNPINRYVLKNGGSTAIAYYWYQGRGRVTASEYRVKWNLLRDAALYGRTEEALVRLVIPIRGDRALAPEAAAGLEAVDAEAREIAAKMMTDVSRILPRIG
jgi:EpsI family protein